MKITQIVLIFIVGVYSNYSAAEFGNKSNNKSSVRSECTSIRGACHTNTDCCSGRCTRGKCT